MDESAIRQALVSPYVQVMTRQKFAELSGVTEGTVEGWLDRGHLPSLVVGRHRMVNMVALSLRCLDQSPGD